MNEHKELSEQLQRMIRKAFTVYLSQEGLVQEV